MGAKAEGLLGIHWRARVLIGMLLLGVGLSFQARSTVELRIVPTEPAAGEEVYLVLRGTGRSIVPTQDRFYAVRPESLNITVFAAIGESHQGDANPAITEYSVLLGRFPPGDYTVTVVLAATTTETRVLGFTVLPRVVPTLGAAGLIFMGLLVLVVGFAALRRPGSAPMLLIVIAISPSALRADPAQQPAFAVFRMAPASSGAKVDRPSATDFDFARRRDLVGQLTDER